MKLLYLHGLASGANSMTVSILKKEFKGKHDIISFDLSHECEKTLNKINDFLEHNKIDLIIATSLGAYYGLCIDTTIPKILFNPAFSPEKDLRQFLGYNKYFRIRENANEEGFVLEEKHLEEFKRFKPIYGKENDTIILSSIDDIIGDTLAQHVDIISDLFYNKHVLFKTTNICGHSMSAKFVKTELRASINSTLGISE